MRRMAGIGAVLLVALQAVVLYVFGQPAICECGFIKLWEGAVLSSGNSQHVADWYTFSHLIHGFIFYWLLGYFFPRLSMGTRFAIAAGVEVAWEVLENTPWLIDHYRQQALAQGYTGDSILNSLSDTAAMLLGFALAWRLPVWASLTIAVGLEAVALYFIRDGLALNVLNLLYQFEFISAWQSGG
jgi:hypothetical protein